MTTIEHEAPSAAARDRPELLPTEASSPGESRRQRLAGHGRRIEHSRRHGPYDPRFRDRHSQATSAALPGRHTTTASVHDELGWYAFSARFFPDRGRHDLESLTAFAAYRGGASRSPVPTPAAARPSAVHAEAPSPGAQQRPGRSTNGRLSSPRTAERSQEATHLAAAAVNDWEGEGGAAR